MIKKIEYHKENSRGNGPNPLLEALPAFENSMAGLMENFNKIRTPTKEDRTADPIERLDKLETISAESFYCFQSWHFKMATKIDSLIRWRYSQRNPLEIKKENEKRFAILNDCEGGVILTKKEKRSSARCLSIVAPAGVGKTTAVQRKLEEYPTLLRHVEYNGKPLECYQIPYLFIQIPGNGTIKSFILEIYRCMDEVIPGINLLEKNKYRTTTELVNGCAKLLNEYNVGILILDETEQLLNGFREKDKILDFLTYVINTLSIPIVFMGTPRFIEMLRGPLHFSRRATSAGSLVVSPMVGEDWDEFITGLWENYQFTATETPLTEELKALMLEISGGNPSEAVDIFCEVQELLILDSENSEELITEESIIQAAELYHNETAQIIKGVNEGDSITRAASQDAWIPDQASLFDGRQLSFFSNSIQNTLDQEIMERYELERSILGEALDVKLDILLGSERLKDEVNKLVRGFKKGTDVSLFIKNAIGKLVALGSESKNGEVAA